jgi:hypothetical protein
MFGVTFFAPQICVKKSQKARVISLAPPTAQSVSVFNFFPIIFFPIWD